MQYKDEYSHIEGAGQDVAHTPENDARRLKMASRILNYYSGNPVYATDKQKYMALIHIAEGFNFAAADPSLKTSLSDLFDKMLNALPRAPAMPVISVAGTAINMAHDKQSPIVRDAQNFLRQIDRRDITGEEQKYLEHLVRDFD